MITRRRALAALAVSAATASLPFPARAEAKAIRVGFQKNGVFLVAKTRGALEERFAKDGVAVTWQEFTFGPPLVEALNVGAIDIGTVGDMPPIFAQAARGRFVYAAAHQATGAAIVVPKKSEIRTVADLKGKRLSIPKGSSAHNVAATALEKVGLSLRDVEAVYLAPADGQAAFAQGAVDAWSIWDPFYALAEQNLGVRTLVLATDVAPQNSFALANRDFASANPKLLKAAIDVVAEVGAWADGHHEEVAQLFADATRTSLDAQRRAVGRARYAVGPITPAIAASQQANADRFFALGLIPRQITVADAVWTSGA